MWGQFLGGSSWCPSRPWVQSPRAPHLRGGPAPPLCLGLRVVGAGVPVLWARYGVCPHLTCAPEGLDPMAGSSQDGVGDPSLLHQKGFALSLWEERGGSRFPSLPRFVPSPRSRAVLCGRGRAGGGDGDAPPGAAARSGAGAAHTGGGGGGGGAMKVKKSGGAGAAAARTEEELGRKALIGPDDVLGLQRVTSGAYRGWRAGGGWGSCPRWAFPGGRKSSRSSSPRRGGKRGAVPLFKGANPGGKGEPVPALPRGQEVGMQHRRGQGPHRDVAPRGAGYHRKDKGMPGAGDAAPQLWSKVGVGMLLAALPITHSLCGRQWDGLGLWSQHGGEFLAAPIPVSPSPV